MKRKQTVPICANAMPSFSWQSWGTYCLFNSNKSYLENVTGIIFLVFHDLQPKNFHQNLSITFWVYTNAHKHTNWLDCTTSSLVRDAECSMQANVVSKLRVCTATHSLEVILVCTQFCIHRNTALPTQLVNTVSYHKFLLEACNK